MKLSHAKIDIHIEIMNKSLGASRSSRQSFKLLGHGMASPDPRILAGIALANGAERLQISKRSGAAPDNVSTKHGVELCLWEGRIATPRRVHHPPLHSTYWLEVLKDFHCIFG